jgi:hypothetical protein
MLKGVKGSGRHVFCGNIVAKLLIILLYIENGPGVIIVPKTWLCDYLHYFLRRHHAGSVIITKVGEIVSFHIFPFNSAFALIPPF